MLNDFYLVPPPTGNATLDDENVDNALSSGKGVIQFDGGTYVLSTQKTIPTGVQFRGLGRGTTVLKISNSSNLGNLFASGGTLADVSFEGITFDGNYSGNASSNQCLIYTAGYTCNRLRITNCEFKNSRGPNLALGNGSGILVQGCFFTATQADCIRLQNPTDSVIIEGNYFTGYDAALGDVGAVYLYCNNGFVDNVTISGNAFKSTTGDHFSVETVCSNGYYARGLTITGNVFDGNSVGGSGISVIGHGASIVGNVWRNGVSTTRSGIEWGGSEATISGNYISNGEIALSPSSPVSTGTNNIVAGNIIETTDSTNTNLFGILCVSQDLLTVVDNTLDFTISGSDVPPVFSSTRLWSPGLM